MHCTGHTDAKFRLSLVFATFLESSCQNFATKNWQNMEKIASNMEC